MFRNDCFFFNFQTETRKSVAHVWKCFLQVEQSYEYAKLLATKILLLIANDKSNKGIWRKQIAEEASICNGEKNRQMEDKRIMKSVQTMKMIEPKSLRKAITWSADKSLVRDTKDHSIILERYPCFMDGNGWEAMLPWIITDKKTMMPLMKDIKVTHKKGLTLKIFCINVTKIENCWTKISSSTSENVNSYETFRNFYVLIYSQFLQDTSWQQHRSIRTLLIGTWWNA